MEDILHHSIYLTPKELCMLGFLAGARFPLFILDARPQFLNPIGPKPNS